MQSIRSRGTKPEERLGEILGRLLAPNEALNPHPGDLPGRPDFIVRELGLAFFADGCFFHMCPKHGRVPDTNRKYWEPKLARNVSRDRAADRALRRHGYSVCRVWEHDLRLRRLDLTESRLRRRLERRRATLRVP
jgi:DNA mismatch endonuclease, patch repair protein